MTLIWILSACFASLTLSLLTSFWLAKKIPQSALNLMVAFSAGTMLSAALLDVLPEALESGQADVHWLLAALLVGLLGFYFLERGAIWRHQHVHGIPDADAPLVIATKASWFGDGVHNFVDGLLIAAAFAADPALGITTTLAILVHEIPQELGDFSLYLAAGYTRQHTLLMNCLSGLPIFAGGVMGWWLLKADDPVVVYVLMVTAASFIYISVSDLFPFLHKQHRVENFAKQTMLLLFGLAWVPAFGLFMH